MSRLVTLLSPHDILLGRGPPVTYYTGNVAFRELVSTRRGEYQSTNCSHKKHVIAVELYNKVAERNGRFLQRMSPIDAEEQGVAVGTEAWRVAHKDAALEKIKQALREKISDDSAQRDPQSPSRRRRAPRTSAPNQTLHAMPNSDETDASQLRQDTAQACEQQDANTQPNVDVVHDAQQQLLNQLAERSNVSQLEQQLANDPSNPTSETSRQLSGLLGQDTNGLFEDSLALRAMLQHRGSCSGSIGQYNDRRPTETSFATEHHPMLLSSTLLANPSNATPNSSLEIWLRNQSMPFAREQLFRQRQQMAQLYQHPQQSQRQGYLLELQERQHQQEWQRLLQSQQLSHPIHRQLANMQQSSPFFTEGAYHGLQNSWPGAPMGFTDNGSTALAALTEPAHTSQRSRSLLESNLYRSMPAAPATPINPDPFATGEYIRRVLHDAMGTGGTATNEAATMAAAPASATDRTEEWAQALTASNEHRDNAIGGDNPRRRKRARK